MARKGEAAGAGRAEALGALLDRLEGELQDSVNLEELERRAKSVTAVAKARQVLNDLRPVRTGPKDEDGPMDAADEQALRDRILSRLDGLVAELEQKGADCCPACGRVEPDRDRLAGVGAGLAETA